MAKLSQVFNSNETDNLNDKADKLKLLVQKRYWDSIDGLFYDIDRNIDYNVPGRQHITWVIKGQVDFGDISRLGLFFLFLHYFLSRVSAKFNCMGESNAYCTEKNYRKRLLLSFNE
jgi:hypothetical protein